MKKSKIFLILIALMCVVLCAFYACNGNAGSNGNSSSGGDSGTSGGNAGDSTGTGGNVDSSNIGGDPTEKPAESNILIVYFSYSGTTERVAEILAEKSCAILVELKPEVPYTAADVNYNNSSSRSQEERRNDSRPEISDETYSAIDIDDYSTVFIGYPIWNGYEPMIIRSFIEHYNGLAGKTVYTFSTSASSGGSAAFGSIKSRCPSADVKENLHFTSSTLGRAESIIENKLNELNITKK